MDLFIPFLLFNHIGVPPLLSRRILETLTYLARNHLYVAKILLQFRLPHPAIKEPVDGRGKAVIVGEGEENISESNEGYVSIAMLLGLLNQPLYLRSIAHLEQVMLWFYWHLCYLISRAIRVSVSADIIIMYLWCVFSC